MGEHDPVVALIDRIVARAHIPSQAAREDLRRELWTHFEEAGASPEAIDQALRRFGAESTVTESLRRVYRAEYVLLYLAKVAASLAASLAAALLIQILVNLRVATEADTWRLAPGFSRAAGVSVAVVLGLVTAWEVGKPPFNRSRAAVAISAYGAVCLLVQLLFTTGIGAFVTATILVVLGYACSRLEPAPARLRLLFGAFAGALYADHLVLSVAFGASRALLASAVLVAVWLSTVRILGRIEHAFGRFLEPAR